MMGFKYNSVISFKSEDDTGLNRVPLGSIIQVTVSGVPKVFTLQDKTGVDTGTTITQAIAGGLLAEAGGSGGASATEFITAPVITSPTAGEIDFYVGTPFTVSAFSTGSGIVTTHLSSDWEVSETADFASIVSGDYDNESDLLSHSMAGIFGNTAYYVRTRFKSAEFVSNWSTPVQFNTFNGGILAPTASITGGVVSVGSGPELNSSAFTLNNVTDTHTSTSWKIYNGATLVWSSLEDASNKLSITVPLATLSVDTSYTLKVQYHGATYISPEASLEFATAAAFIPTPELSGSATVGENNTFIVTDAAYDAGGTYTIVVSTGSVVNSAGNYSWTVPSVIVDTAATMDVYYVKNGETSIVATHNVTILNLLIIDDAAIVNADFAGNEEFNDGFDY